MTILQIWKHAMPWSLYSVLLLFFNPYLQIEVSNEVLLIGRG